MSFEFADGRNNNVERGAATCYLLLLLRSAAGELQPAAEQYW